MELIETCFYCQCQVLLQQLEEELNGKYSEEILSTWNNMKTYFDRERLKEEKIPSGSAASQVMLSKFTFLLYRFELC